MKKSAEANADKPMGVGRAAVINMSSILGSIGSNAEGGMYSYRASKVTAHNEYRSTGKIQNHILSTVGTKRCYQIDEHWF